MEDIGVLSYDKEEAEVILLFTEGLGPGIAIVITGQGKETTSHELAENFIAMYHWNGRTDHQIQLL